MSLHYRQPRNESYQDTFNFLAWNQFPAILEKSVKYFSVLPKTGIYQHVAPGVKSFEDALLASTERQFTLSGVGSLIDYDKFGQQVKKPSPYLQGTDCSSNSLCLEGTCFGFQEGVIENNNLLNNMCWELAFPCLKDLRYSDSKFELKMNSYFEMFFAQAPAVLQAYQRTRLLKEAVKVVCTDTNIKFTGPVIGGANGLELPFYIDPVDATAFPDLTALPAGASIGGANLAAFTNYVAPRLFSGNFTGGMENVTVYGLSQDKAVALEQTASVTDHMLDRRMLDTLMAMAGRMGSGNGASELGDFRHDGLFPTFKTEGGQIMPITQEILEASTIAGYVQTSNPEHSLATIRGLLFVPENWKFSLVEPPEDNFSSLGLGQGLNFANNTPGVHPILSSSIFARNKIGRDGQVILGDVVGKNGMVVKSVKGIQARDKAIKEAVRTDLLMTYTDPAVNNASAGQLPSVGRPIVPQGRASGFALKSTMYIGSDVKGTARPVLLLFETDTPRSAKPIKVCNVATVNVDQTQPSAIVSCAPGGQKYVVLTFNKDVSAEFSVADEVVYRSGPKGAAYIAAVTAVSGSVVTIDTTGLGEEILPCCAGSKDEYGVQGTLFVNTGATAKTSEVMKARYDSGSSSIFLELFDPIAASLLGATGTLTLDALDASGAAQVLLVKTVAAAHGVFVQIDAQAGETCDLSTLDCDCLVNAVFTLD